MPGKPCPACGGTLIAHVGIIEYPAIDRYSLQTVRRRKLGAFLACERCEHCEDRAETDRARTGAR